MQSNRFTGALETALVLFAVAAPAAFAASPVVSSFSPASGTAGTAVTVSGSGFDGATLVTFGGAPAASFVVNNPALLTAIVPVGGLSGGIVVTTPGGSSTAPGNFIVIPSPAIALSRGSGPPTTTLTVTGTAFGGNDRLDVFFDTTDITMVGTNGDGSFSAQVTVPVSAQPGAHWISAVGRRSGLAAQLQFTVRTNWSELGFSNLNQRANVYENTLSPAAVSAGLDELWAASTGGSIRSSPVIANGVAYVGSNDAKVYAFDISTGSLKWTFTTPDPVRSSPAVANGVVYVGSRHLYALDASTGALKWTFMTGGYIEGSPVVVDGVVYFGSYDTKVYAVDATTGLRKWDYTVFWSLFSTPAVVNGVVYISSTSGMLFAFDAMTGTLRWSTPNVASQASAPSATLVAFGRVYTGTGFSGLVALDPRSGVRQIVPFASPPSPPFYDVSTLPSPAAADGMVFVSCVKYDPINSSSTPSLCALDGRSSAVVWSRGPFIVTSSPAVAGGVVYVGAFDGHLYALDQKTGGVLWDVPTGGPIVSSPAVSDGVIYVGSDDRFLRAFVPSSSFARIRGAPGP